MHNSLANKNKSNIEFLHNIKSSQVLNVRKKEILLQMKNKGIDFRQFMAFKNALFDSEDVIDNIYLPVKSFINIGEYEMQGALLGDLNQLILKEIQIGPNVDLSKICDLVDLYFYIPPVSMKNNPSNESQSMWQVFSSNMHKGPTSNESAVQGGTLKKLLDFLWIKVSEKFRGLAEAYRFFDVNFNNRVSYNEFQKALDHLQVKF